MGSGIRYSCSKCKKEFELLEGIGFMDCSHILMDYENEFNLLNKYQCGINKERLDEILKNKNYVLDEEEYGYRTYQCPKCNEISNQFYFKLMPLNKEDKKFISKFECHKCKTELKILKNFNKCPVCGGVIAEDKTVVILWD